MPAKDPVGRGDVVNLHSAVRLVAAEADVNEVSQERGELSGGVREDWGR